MRQLSPAGQQAVNDIAARHGFSPDAVASMLEAVIAGNGTMAQFNHPEFAGSGQWMRGGMTMVSDMFNNYLKGRVDGLCSELSNLVANQPGLLQTGSFQSQSQSGGGQNVQNQSGFGGGMQQQDSGGTFSGVSLFVPPAPGQGTHWWPADLGMPNSTGAQNNVRYAYFAQARRLAIDVGGRVTVYDTLDHQIGGFSQQQSFGGSLGFSSQYGLIDVASLPVVSIDGQAPQPVFQPAPQPVPPPEPVFQAPSPAQVPPQAAPPASEGDIFATIEKLAGLRAKGILSDEEFAAKKAELLARL
ncbi:SHOCT domain-containing protein [Zavarzinia sp.]|uniref:SHOCT domain-containing protein n=1 Tax=Zavarzinia sp. TaxID=2027920 RepID=UPI0035639E58